MLRHSSLDRQDLFQTHEPDQLPQLRRGPIQPDLTAGPPCGELKAGQRVHRRRLCSQVFDVPVHVDTGHPQDAGDLLSAFVLWPVDERRAVACPVALHQIQGRPPRAVGEQALAAAQHDGEDH